MNHTVNILPYVVVDFVWINRARENVRLRRPAFFFLMLSGDSTMWQRFCSCEKLPFLSYPQNLDWGLLTRTLAARYIVVVEVVFLVFFSVLNNRDTKKTTFMLWEDTVCVFPRGCWWTVVKTQRRTRVLFYSNTIIWTLCVHSNSFWVLFLGANEIAATFSCARAHTGKQQCDCLCVCIRSLLLLLLNWKLHYFMH